MLNTKLTARIHWDIFFKFTDDLFAMSSLISTSESEENNSTRLLAAGLSSYSSSGSEGGAVYMGFDEVKPRAARINSACSKVPTKFFCPCACPEPIQRFSIPGKVWLPCSFISLIPEYNGVTEIRSAVIWPRHSGSGSAYSH